MLQETKDMMSTIKSTEMSKI